MCVAVLCLFQCFLFALISRRKNSYVFDTTSFIFSLFASFYSHFAQAHSFAHQLFSFFSAEVYSHWHPLSSSACRLFRWYNTHELRRGVLPYLWHISLSLCLCFSMPLSIRLFPVLSSSPFRYLNNNQLTSLPLGIFDNLPALLVLLVCADSVCQGRCLHSWNCHCSRHLAFSFSVSSWAGKAHLPGNLTTTT